VPDPAPYVCFSHLELKTLVRAKSNRRAPDYVVTYRRDRVPHWACTCPSFAYSRGLDRLGHCKHVAQRRSTRCDWTSATRGGSPRRTEDGELVCPDCGELAVRDPSSS
jgi:hypothetical protein